MAKAIYSIGSTYIKSTGTESANIKDTSIDNSCTESACTRTDFNNNAYISNASTKSILIGDASRRNNYIKSTSSSDICGLAYKLSKYSI